MSLQAHRFQKNKANHSSAHSELLDDVLYAVGRLPDVRVWKRNVGLATPVHSSHPIYFGVEGESDLDGIIFPLGRRLAIEIKTGAGKLTGDQKKWRDMIIKFGGVFIEARSVEQCLKELEIHREARTDIP